MCGLCLSYSIPRSPYYEGGKPVDRIRACGKPGERSLDSTRDFPSLQGNAVGEEETSKLRNPRHGSLTYPATFFACARNFAHRFLAAFPIFALAAADSTRFFTPFSSRFVESPQAFAAAS